MEQLTFAVMDNVTLNMGNAAVHSCTLLKLFASQLKMTEEN